MRHKLYKCPRCGREEMREEEEGKVYEHKLCGPHEPEPGRKHQAYYVMEE